MANQPKTPKTGWRIPEDVKDGIKWVARDNHETVTAAVIRALRREIRLHLMERERRGLDRD